jgi:hypothetical protein
VNPASVALAAAILPPGAVFPGRSSAAHAVRLGQDPNASSTAETRHEPPLAMSST